MDSIVPTDLGHNLLQGTVVVQIQFFRDIIAFVQLIEKQSFLRLLDPVCSQTFFTAPLKLESTTGHR
jgi:hypothetical protein